jgi:hypothetical protein
MAGVNAAEVEQVQQEENPFAELECCLGNYEHYVNDPVVLACGENACRKCLEDFNQINFLCRYCRISHEKSSLDIEPVRNNRPRHMIQNHLHDLNGKLNEKIQSTIDSILGLLLPNLFCI